MNKLFVLERDHRIDAGRTQGWKQACQQTDRNNYDAGACVYCWIGRTSIIEQTNNRAFDSNSAEQAGRGAGQREADSLQNNQMEDLRMRCADRDSDGDFMPPTCGRQRDNSVKPERASNVADVAKTTLSRVRKRREATAPSST